MSYRFMRILVMFDLPTETSLERRQYRLFRKYLISEGFIMMQFSVYSKMCLNMNAVDIVAKSIRKNKPPKGLVQLMTVTERQFARMEFVQGEADTTYIQTEERLIIL